jgi:hypothetical protein
MGGSTLAMHARLCPGMGDCSTHPSLHVPVLNVTTLSSTCSCCQRVQQPVVARFKLCHGTTPVHLHVTTVPCSKKVDA